MKRTSAARETWRKIYVRWIAEIYEEHRNSGLVIEPDEAMNFMEELFAAFVEKDPETGKGNIPNLRVNFGALRREAHHFAVDQFYKTFYGTKRGAPSLSTDYLNQVLELQKQGLTHGKIAEKLGQSRDAVRQQTKIALKRWDEKVKSLREIAKRNPEFWA